MQIAKKSWKRAIALFLAVVMALSFVPNITARAAGEIDVAFSSSNADSVALPAAVEGTKVYGEAVASEATADFFIVHPDSDEGGADEFELITDYDATDITANIYKDGVKLTLESGVNAANDVSVAVAAGTAANSFKATLTVGPKAPKATYTVKLQAAAVEDYYNAIDETAAAVISYEVTAKPVTITLADSYSTAAINEVTFADISDFITADALANSDVITGATFTAYTENDASQLALATATISTAASNGTNVSDSYDMTLVPALADATHQGAEYTQADVDNKIGTGNYSIILDPNVAGNGPYELSEDGKEVIYKLSSTVTTVKPLEGTPIIIDANGAVVTDEFKLTATKFNRTAGVESAKNVGPYSTTLTNKVTGETLIFKWNIAGDSTSRGDWYIAPTSLVYDYSVTKEGSNAYKAADKTLENLVNPVYFTPDTAGDFNPQVWTGEAGDADKAVSSSDVTFYYFKSDAAIAGTDADIDTSTGALTTTTDAFDIAKPTAAGEYLVMAVAKKSGNYAASVVDVQPLIIVPTEVTVVPTKGQGKKYGASEGDIEYLAYTFYTTDKTNTNGARIADLQGADGPIEKMDETEVTFYETPEKTRTEYQAELANLLKLKEEDKNGSWLAAKRDNKLYNETGKLNDSAKPVIIRDRKLEDGTDGMDPEFEVGEKWEFGEKIGTYDIVLNQTDEEAAADQEAEDDGDPTTEPLYQVGNYAVTLTAETFTISKRSLENDSIRVQFFDDDNEEYRADKIGTIKTYSTYVKDHGETYAPGFIVTDKIQAPVFKANSTDFDLKDGRVQYADKDKTVGYRLNVKAGGAEGEDNNFEIGGFDVSSRPGKNQIDLDGINNYEDTFSFEWEISNSGTKYYDVEVYVGEAENIANKRAADLTDEKTVTKGFNGKAYSIYVPQPTKWIKGTKSDDLDAEEDPIVTYKNNTKYTYVDGGTIKEEPVWTSFKDKAPEYTEAGTYSVTYKIESNTGKIDPVERTITITISKAEFNYQLADVSISVGDEDYIIQEKANIENTAATVDNANAGTARLGTIAGKVSKEDDAAAVVGYPLTLYYTYDESEVETAGTYKILAEAIDESRAKKIVESAHKKAYENALKDDEKSEGFILKVDYSGDKAVDDNDDPIKVGDDQIEFAKKGERVWSKLSEEARTALMKKDLDALMVAVKYNSNYTMTPLAGNLYVGCAELPLAVYVHSNLKWVDNAWTDFALPDGDLGGEAATYNWKYGAYDKVSGMIELYLDRTELAADEQKYYDDIDMKVALPSEFASKVNYRIKNGASFDNSLGDKGTIAASDIDTVLDTLKAGDAYDLYVNLPADGTKVFQANTNSGVFKVHDNTLTITSAVGGTIAVDDEFEGIRDGAGSVVVTAEDGNKPINESGTTYQLVYLIEPEGAEDHTEASATADYVATYAGQTYTDAEYHFYSAAGLKALGDANPLKTAGTYTVFVVAEPIKTATVDMTGSFTASAAKKVTLKVTPQKAGENDIVADIIMRHTKEQAGTEITVAKGVNGKFSKTYGTYTENDKYDNGKYIFDEKQNYVPKTSENTVEFNGDLDLIRYIKDELLSNNGYAVEHQNTYLYWGKNAAGTKSVLKRYADAEKTAFTPDGLPNGYDVRGNYIDWFIDKDGNLVDETFNDDVSDGAEPIVTYDDEDRDVLDAGNGKSIVQGVKISAELIEDPNKIFAYTTSGSGEEEDEAKIGVKNNNSTLSYTLTKKTDVSGTAKIKVTVSRDNYADISFNVIVSLDADAPVISIRNNEISSEASTELVTKTKTTDKYVKEPLEFSVSVSGAKEEGGAFYYWSNDVLTKAQVTDPSQVGAIKNNMWVALDTDTLTTPEKEGGYILYVKAVDENGNVSYASSKTAFTLDTTAPAISKSEDSTIVYDETPSTYLVAVGGKANLKITDAALDKVELIDADGTATEIKPDGSNNYQLEASKDTYTIVATDKAKNVTTAKIDVNQAVDNVGNAITVTYDGKTYDLTKLTDPADPTKKLFDISANAGEASYSDATFEKDAKTGAFKNNIAVRGEGEVKDGILTVTKAGTFAIKLTTGKNEIWGETETIALLTVNKGTRQVGIKLVEDPTAETKVAKDSFSKTESDEILRYIDYVFDVDSVDPADSFVTVSYYKKGETTPLATKPELAGDYEISVAIADDGLYNASDSLKSDAAAVKDFQKASYSITAGNKVKITNDDTKGTVKVADKTGELDAEALNKVADGTELTITVTAAEGYKFNGWTKVAGTTLADDKATEIKVTVTGDVELTTVYATGVKITEQPKSLKLYPDEKAVFTVVATGDGEDDLTYQWQMKTKSETAFRDIADATSATYEIAKVSAENDGESYRVVVKSKASGDEKISEVAVLEVSGMSIEGAEVVFSNDNAVYTGKAITPVISKITVGNVELSTANYEMATTNFVDAKTYDVTITGKGDYSGTTTAKFTIAPKAVTADMFTIEDVNYTGKAIEAPVVAKDGETELVAGTDYEVAYKNNTEVGTATATITGKGNYTGSVDVKFAILGKSIAKATVTGIATAAYTGKAITPKVTVKLDGKTLKKDTDYTVTYKNNTKVGTATVTITGKGDYSGKITKKFLIKQISFKYRAYVQKKNWMAWSTAKVSGTSASKMAGTTDNLRMETIQMQLSGVTGQIKYRAYVEKMGWTQWATTADTTTYAGTKGLSRRVEMIQLQASGQVATLYDMYYRTYCEKFGWLGWVKSGEKSGSAGYARKLEAFQVNFVRKGEKFSIKSDTTKGFYDVAKDGKNPK